VPGDIPILAPSGAAGYEHGQPSPGPFKLTAGGSSADGNADDTSLGTVSEKVDWDSPWLGDDDEGLLRD
jgi:hypothetical protein